MNSNPPSSTSSPGYPMYTMPSYPPEPSSTKYPSYDASSTSKYPPPPSFNPSSYYPSTDPLPVPHEARFAPPKGYQDLWATLLFLLHALTMVGLAIWLVPSFSSLWSRNANEKKNTEELTFAAREITSLVVSALGSMVLALIYVVLMRKVPEFLIKFTFWGSAAMYFVGGVLAIIQKIYVLGVILIVVGILFTLTWFIYRKRIPFAAVLLRTVSNITLKYPGTIWTGLFALVFGFAYMVFLLVMIAATFEKFPGTKSSTSTNPKDVKVDRNAIFVCLFLLFSWYWTTQVTKNVVHVTVSGVFSSFYFLQGSSTGMPRWPTLGSLKRALTSSFGSICFGSLLIAIIQFIRMLLRMAMDSSGQSDACTFFLCCIECLLQFIQQLAELFNVYAFTQVAMYGKPYCRAAKDTMHLLKDRGIDLIINNNLTGMVLGFGGLMVGGLTGLLAFIVYLIYPPHSFASSEITSFTLVVVGAIVFGSIVFFLLAEVIESGTATTFVALAEDPATLKATKPELWEEIRRTYPQAAFVSMYG